MSTYTEVKFELETSGPAVIKITKVNDKDEEYTISENCTVVYKTYCVPGKPVTFKIKLIEGAEIAVKKVFTTIYDRDMEIATLSEKLRDPVTKTVTTIQESPKNSRYLNIADRPKYNFEPFTLRGEQSCDILFFCQLIHFYDWCAKYINNDNRV
jgi:hypothetical protein